MKRENLSGRIFQDIRPRQSACTTQNWLFKHTLYTLALKFNHLQSSGAGVLFTAVTVLICACCSQAPPLQNHPAGKDSLIIHINSRLPYEHLDLFIYSDSLTQALETHIRSRNAGILRLEMPCGGKIITAIADLQGSFSEDNLPQQFSVMEHLTMYYADENPEHPLQSGYCHAYAGTHVELAITPLLCPVIIRSICMRGDTPLLKPVIQLENVNENALILQADGFHPASVMSEPEALKHPFMMIRELPFDIGSSPQEADMTLWCYPNEEESQWKCTTLSVSGFMHGELHRFSIPLGRILRGSSTVLDIDLKDYDSESLDSIQSITSALSSSDAWSRELKQQ